MKPLHASPGMKTYLVLVTSAGTAALVTALALRQFGDPLLYGSWLLLGLLASTLKIRIPGLTATMSPNFLFLALGPLAFTYTETALLAAAAIPLQCSWHAANKPRITQVLFNTAALQLGIAAAFAASWFLRLGAAGRSPALLLCVSCLLVYAVNTALVSGVLTFLEGRAFAEVWRNSLLWSFPYYTLMSATGGLVALIAAQSNWYCGLLALPALYLLYSFYSELVERFHERHATRDLRLVA